MSGQVGGLGEANSTENVEVRKDTSLLLDVRRARVIAPDDHSITRFAPYVSITPEARDVLVEAVEALRGLYLEEVNGRLCRLPDDEISDGTRRQEGTCNICARKWERATAVLNQVGWSK